MLYNKSILMTLGHNSSVIFYDGIGKPIGFEEERLSEIKSDSSYPVKSLEKILEIVDEETIQNSNVFISHWFDVFEVNQFPVKYFDHSHFKKIVDKYNLTVIPVNQSFTHHDAHAYSTLAFSEMFNYKLNGPEHFIVADGFGNNQEVISIYVKSETGSLQAIKKIYGFDNSLGLLYQYATSYCGMKENQDEYKFLGYEAHIREYLSDKQIEHLNLMAYNFSMDFMKRCIVGNTFKSEYAYNIIDYNALYETKRKMHQLFDTVMVAMHIHEVDDSNHSDFRTRAVIGYYVQSCLENCLRRIISKFRIKNAFLSGGCFLNVKLNNTVLNSISGSVCVNPLSGDQGAAIGLFRKYTNARFNFDDLCFGIRKPVQLAQVTKDHLVLENIFVVEDEQTFVDCVAKLIMNDNIVNVIQGNMEFGPRALCNTSTLAKPTKANSEYINMVNQRNEVMPMAPVIKNDMATVLFHKQEISRIIGSNLFMIITMHVKKLSYAFDGVLHSEPCTDVKTCRPQIVFNTESNIYKILDLLKSQPCLINTSFNTHGIPILYSFESAIKDFRKQRARDKNDILALVILNK